MRTKTVTNFIKRFEHVYDIRSSVFVQDNLSVYFDRETGQFHTFGYGLDYTETVVPWVALTGLPVYIWFPNTLPMRED